MINAKTFIVCGPEGSGTTAMTHWLAAHPDRGEILHASFPTPARAFHMFPVGSRKEVYRRWDDVAENAVHGLAEPGKGPRMGFLDLGVVDPDRRARVVVMCRDPHCTMASQKRRALDAEGRTAWTSNVGFQVGKLHESLDKWGGVPVFVSYETLVCHGARYFRQVLRELRLDPERFPWDDLRITDGNAKYRESSDGA